VYRHVGQQRMRHLVAEATEPRAAEEAAFHEADTAEPGELTPQGGQVAPVAAGLGDHQQPVAHLGGGNHRQGRARQTKGETMDTTTLLVIVLVVLLLGGGGFFYTRRV